MGVSTSASEVEVLLACPMNDNHLCPRYIGFWSTGQKGYLRAVGVNETFPLQFSGPLELQVAGVKMGYKYGRWISNSVNGPHRIMLSLSLGRI